MIWGVYIIVNSAGLLYTGITPNIGRRVRAHNDGKGAKYTRGRGPWTMVYWEPCGPVTTALKREAEIKALTKTQKLALIKSHS